MDPVSISIGVISAILAGASLAVATFTAVLAIVQTVAAVYQSWMVWKKGREGKGLTEGDSLYKKFMRILKKYNRVAAYFGGALAGLRNSKNMLEEQKAMEPWNWLIKDEFENRLRSFEDPIRKCFDDLKAKLSTKSASDNDARLVAKEAKQLARHAEKFVDDLWAKVTGGDQILLQEQKRLPELANNDREREFCQGAILIQNAPAKQKSIDLIRDTDAGATSGAWGIRCKYCKLDVGVYQAVHMTPTGKPLKSELLPAASHLTSHKDMSDFRAFYRCLHCFCEGKIVDLETAVAFEFHMNTHPAFVLGGIEMDEVEFVDEAARSRGAELLGELPQLNLPTTVSVDVLQGEELDSSDEYGDESEKTYLNVPNIGPARTPSQGSNVSTTSAGNIPGAFNATPISGRSTEDLGSPPMGEAYDPYANRSMTTNASTGASISTTRRPVADPASYDSQRVQPEAPRQRPPVPQGLPPAVPAVPPRNSTQRYPSRHGYPQ